MIEKGLTPPPILLDEKHTTTPEASLRRGIVLLSLGIGLGVAAAFLAPLDRNEGLLPVSVVAAAIVGSLGVGNLVYYFVARRKPDDTARTL